MKRSPTRTLYTVALVLALTTLLALGTRIAPGAASSIAMTFVSNSTPLPIPGVAVVSNTVTSAVAAQGNKTITPDTGQTDLPAKSPKNKTRLGSQRATQGPKGVGPANDNCANAVFINGCPFTDTKDTTGATDEQGEPQSTCTLQSSSVWYTYAPGGNAASVTVDTCSSNFDTAIMVYSVNGAACDFANFVPVTCNDDFCGDGFQSSVTFLADAGQTYKIQVGGFDGETGNLVVNVACTVLTCPPTVIHGTLGSNDPSFPGPRASGNQIGRLNRNGIASSCASPKTCLIFDPANSRAFDAYTFTNNSGATACVTGNLNVLTQSAANYQSNAYLGSYDPNNICTNYLADPGLSSGSPPTPTIFSFNVPAGANFVIVVHTTNPGETGGNYDLTVVGNICAPSACTITCPADITQPNDPNQCGAVVNYTPPNPGGCTVLCSPAGGSFFPVGITTVTCSATGSGGQAKPTPNAAQACTTITESTSQAITGLNSVSCNNGVGHTDNSYWRAFTLPTFGIVGAFDVMSVDIGVELASAGAQGSPGKPTIGPRKSGAAKTAQGKAAPTGASQPLTVRIYTSSTAFPAGFPGSLTLIATTNTTVTDQTGTIVNVPVTGTAAAGSQLVVEVFTPNGEAAGNLFFIGSNAAAETGPSYLNAADCGVPNPTTTAALGFPSMHIVMNVNGCEQVVGGGSTCTFTVTVNDTQPPTITCPPNQTAVTDQNACPAPACLVVTFPPPVASDNCPGVGVVCNPPSGSCFPTGTTTVTCTATDASGNTATCSFPVTTFDTALEDDSNPAIILLWNSNTGAYRFCCNGITFTGVGKATRQGCVYTLETPNAPDRRVLGRVDKAVHAGAGSLQSPPGAIRCTITDRNTLNDTLLPACQ
jgi:hypothetical protein